MPLQTLLDFLEPVNITKISNDEGYKDTQLGKHIAIYEDSLPDITAVDMVILGCGEMRGIGQQYTNKESPNAIRAAYYQLYHWHTEVKVADLGNVKCGSSLQDSYAALRTVVRELVEMGKKVIIIGGSHDNTLPQYQAYSAMNKIVDAACVDSRIDLDMESLPRAVTFLFPLNQLFNVYEPLIDVEVTT